VGTHINTTAYVFWFVIHFTSCTSQLWLLVPSARQQKRRNCGLLNTNAVRGQNKRLSTTVLSGTDLRNVDPGPEELQMFSHLLWLVLGVEDGELREDAHVGALQS